MKYTDDLIYIGVNDHKIDLFEGQYAVPNGISYNSYVLIDEKIAVFDTVDARFGDLWLSQLKEALGERTPDYLIVLHMEPDHSANIKKFLEAYPQTAIIGNAKTFVMMDQFFDLKHEKRITVSNDERLSLGKHRLRFIFAPMVHWPEVMMVYEESEQLFFSADAFGKFGANDVKDDWAEEARRYYMGIVGKYGAQVLSLFKKIEGLPIQKICPLHGPVLEENIDLYLNYYQTWASYAPESKGVVIVYASIYGHTKQAAEYLHEQLQKQNVASVLYDLARCDMSLAVSDAFRYNQLVLACATYNADLFPCMKTYLHHLVERNYQKRSISLIENGSWAPLANKVMKDMLSNCREIEWGSEITIRSALTQTNYEQLNEMAKNLK